jgi:atypical dual specificity phosphatase
MANWGCEMLTQSVIGRASN